MTGSAAKASRSVGTRRPLVVAQVFIFEHEALLAAGVKPGIAASVRRALWDAARVWPASTGAAPRMLDDRQRALLAALAGDS